MNSMNIEKPPEEGCLLIGLGSDLFLSFAPRWPIKRLSAKGRRYERVGVYGTLTMFYDWLRDSSGRLIGVRFYPLDAGLLLKLSSLRYVETRTYQNVTWRSIAEGEVEIYFGDDRDLDPAISVDQDFLYSDHFETASGDMLFAFVTAPFTEQEWEGIRRAQVHWEDFAIEYEESAEKKS